MTAPKIQLSPAEAKLLANADIILTKNRVMAKMLQLLEGVQNQMLSEAQTFSNAHVFEIPPKISRGENYLGLPYLVLDYPRLFKQEAVFTVRSFFWWGHFFSSTLQLSGSYKDLYLPKIASAYATFSNHHIGIHPDPWQHHFEIDNYNPIAGLHQDDFKNLLQQQAHIKLAVKWPVANWPEAADLLLGSWRHYLQVIA